MRHIKTAALLCLSALLLSCGGSGAQKQVTKEEFLATARSYDKEKALEAISSIKLTGRYLNKIYDPDDEEERSEYDLPQTSFQYVFFDYNETKLSMIYDGTYFFDKNDGVTDTGLTIGFYETGSWVNKSVDNGGGALSFKGTFEGELTMVNGRGVEPAIHARAECEFRVDAHGMREADSIVITVEGKEVYVYQDFFTCVYKN